MKTKAEAILYIAIAVSLLADFFITGRDHPVFWWHQMPVFDFLLGLVACVIIIKCSKFLAKHWLQRREDYYD